MTQPSAVIDDPAVLLGALGDVSQCSTCKHLRSWVVTGTVTSCAAFPTGIGDKVWSNDLDHRQPLDGDGGVRWESNGEPYPEWALPDAEDPARSRTAGHDTHPGGEQLKHYWTTDPEALSQWATTDHPYTALYNILLEKMDGNELLAHKTAGAWYYKVFGHGPTAGLPEGRAAAGFSSPQSDDEYGDLIWAIRRAFDPKEHPKYPPGTPGGKGGEWMPKVGLPTILHQLGEIDSHGGLQDALKGMKVAELKAVHKHMELGSASGKKKADLVAAISDAIHRPDGPGLKGAPRKEADSGSPLGTPTTAVSHPTETSLSKGDRLNLPAAAGRLLDVADQMQWHSIVTTDTDIYRRDFVEVHLFDRGRSGDKFWLTWRGPEGGGGPKKLVKVVYSEGGLGEVKFPLSLKAVTAHMNATPDVVPPLVDVPTAAPKPDVVVKTAASDLLDSLMAGGAKSPDLPPKKAINPVDQVLSGDFSGLTRVGPKGGANPGGVFEAKDGSRWYVKAQKSAEHANNEALAAAFYREAGVDVPEVVRGRGTPGLPGESHTATRMVDGARTDLKMHVEGYNRKFLDQIYEGFAVDAWLANWDVAGENPDAGWDNIVSTEPYWGGGGRAVRIDAGGALLYRGLGGPKGNAFGPVVTEWDKLRDPTSDRASAQTFRLINASQMLASADRVQKISPARIRQLVAKYEMPSSVADTLVARRKDLKSRASALQNKSHTAGARTEWADITAAAPAKMLTLPQHMVDNGYDLDRALDSGVALMEYQADGYKPINGRLLRGEFNPLSSDEENEHDAYTRAIDRAMKLGPLADDIVVYRGERDPSRNFPKGEWSPVGGMEGAEWRFPAFSSTTANPKFAADFAHEYKLRGVKGAATSQPTVLRIRAPKGTKAVAMNGGGVNSDELEVILDRDIGYRVVADHGVIDGVRMLDMEVF